MFEIGDILGKAWEDFKNNAGVLIVATIIGLVAYFGLLGGGMIGIFAATAAMTTVTKNFAVIQITQFAGQMLLGCIVGAIIQFLVLGAFSMCLKIVRGQPAEIGDLFSQVGKLVPAIILGLIHSFVGQIAFWFCIIPSIIWAVMTCLSQLYLLDKDLDPIAAIQASMAATSGHRLNLFLLGLVFFLLSVAGTFTCGLAWLVLVPMSGLALARIYVILSEAAAQQAA